MLPFFSCFFLKSFLLLFVDKKKFGRWQRRGSAETRAISHANDRRNTCWQGTWLGRHLGLPGNGDTLKATMGQAPISKSTRRAWWIPLFATQRNLMQHRRYCTWLDLMKHAFPSREHLIVCQCAIGIDAHHSEEVESNPVWFLHFLLNSTSDFVLLPLLSALLVC